MLKKYWITSKEAQAVLTMKMKDVQEEDVADIKDEGYTRTARKAS